MPYLAPLRTGIDCISYSKNWLYPTLLPWEQVLTVSHTQRIDCALPCSPENWCWLYLIFKELTVPYLAPLRTGVDCISYSNNRLYPTLLPREQVFTVSHIQRIDYPSLLPWEQVLTVSHIQWTNCTLPCSPESWCWLYLIFKEQTVPYLAPLRTGSDCISYSMNRLYPTLLPWEQVLAVSHIQRTDCTLPCSLENWCWLYLIFKELTVLFLAPLTTGVDCISYSKNSLYPTLLPWEQVLTVSHIQRIVCTLPCTPENWCWLYLIFKELPGTEEWWVLISNDLDCLPWQGYLGYMNLKEVLSPLQVYCLIKLDCVFIL